MNKNKILNLVEKKINLLVKEFKKYPERFRYEGDMVCKLYCNLSQIKELTNKNTINYQLLHSEFPCYNNSRERFDIVIFEPNPKNEKPFIAIECKFDEYKIPQIEKDFIKLTEPKNKITKPLFIIFKTEKNGKFDEHFENLKTKYNKVKTFYEFKEIKHN